MTVWIISGVLGFAGGYAACWFTKVRALQAVAALNKAVDTVKKL